MKVLKTALVAGTLAALACTIYILSVQYFGGNPLAQPKYLMYTGLYALFFIAAMKYQRDNINQRRLLPQQGILLGIILNGTAALLSSSNLFLYLKHTQAGKSLLRLHQKDLFMLIEKSKENLVKSMGSSTYQELFEGIEHLRPSDLAGDLAIGLMMAGLFHTFLFMLIFKTK